MNVLQVYPLPSLDPATQKWCVELKLGASSVSQSSHNGVPFTSADEAFAVGKKLMRQHRVKWAVPVRYKSYKQYCTYKAILHMKG